MNGMLKIWHFRLLALGWHGWLGLALLLVSLVLALAVLLPGHRHLQQLQGDIAQLRRELNQHQGQWIDRSPQASLNAFYRFLPPESAAVRQVSAFFAAADANGIDLDQAEYVLTRDRIARMSRYQVILPLRGTYTDIRFFVIELLNAMPAVAINELSFKREDVHAQEVEARLRLTIYLGRQP